MNARALKQAKAQKLIQRHACVCVLCCRLLFAMFRRLFVVSYLPSVGYWLSPDAGMCVCVCVTFVGCCCRLMRGVFLLCVATWHLLCVNCCVASIVCRL